MNHRVELYPENIPPQLKGVPQWICYRRVPKKKDPKKTDKLPIDPKTGKMAAVNNPKTWGSFEQALSRYKNNLSISGVGIVLTQDLGIVGIDFDECLAQEGYFLWGDDDVKKFSSYAEKSPSGEGIRIFIFGTLPPNGRKKGKIEIYNSGRFLTVTGNVIGEYRSVENRQNEILAFHKNTFLKKSKTESLGDVTTAIESLPLILSDDEIIRKAKKANNRDLFKRLWSGDHSGYPSASEGDQVLCNILAFWTRRDAQAIDRLYRRSNLMRLKWDERHYASGDTYGQVTIQKAIDFTRDVYDPMTKLPEKKSRNASALDAAIASLNSKHAILMMGGKCVVLNEILDPVFDRPDVNFSNTQDFCNRYRNQKVNVFKNSRMVDVGIGEIWLDSPGRREFDGIVFDPSKIIIPGYYNLFRGFAVKPKQGSWERMRDHIFEIICGGHDESFYYLRAWMARLVQDPGGKRPGVVIVLRGRQGTGKGCFATNFGHTFGNHFLHLISYHLVAGRFNSHFKDALLVFVDEGFWGGDKQAEGALKGMITEDYILVEAKYKDAFRVKNNANFIFASNNDWVVPAALEERRFFVMDVSDKRMNNSKYFTAIYQEMANGGREAMLFDLLKHDISNFNLRKFPRGEALLDQIIQTMPSVKKFWFEILRKGGIIRSNDPSNDHFPLHSPREWPDKFPCEVLYALYLNFSSVIVGDRYKLIDKIFGKQLKEVCPGIKRKKKDQVWHYFFPTLLECRQQFERLVNMKVDWGNEENEAED